MKNDISKFIGYYVNMAKKGEFLDEIVDSISEIKIEVNSYVGSQHARYLDIEVITPYHIGNDPIMLLPSNEIFHLYHDLIVLKNLAFNDIRIHIETDTPFPKNTINVNDAYRYKIEMINCVCPDYKRDIYEFKNCEIFSC